MAEVPGEWKGEKRSSSHGVAGVAERREKEEVSEERKSRRQEGKKARSKQD